MKTTVEDEEIVTDAVLAGAGTAVIHEPPPEEHRKFHFDGGQVEIAAHLVHELDPDVRQLHVIRCTDCAASSVLTLCATAPELASGEAIRGHPPPAGTRH